MLTQAELQSQLFYNPETGLFTRLVSNNKKHKVGDIAGGINQTSGYFCIKLFNKRYHSHRLAWLYVYGEFPSLNIDHINRIRTDNRISNLRIATNSENQQNRIKCTNNKAGYKGVYKTKNYDKYVAQATLNGKHIYIGHFNSAKEASDAYNKFSLKNHKDFHCS